MSIVRAVVIMYSGIRMPNIAKQKFSISIMARKSVEATLTDTPTRVFSYFTPIKGTSIDVKQTKPPMATTHLNVTSVDKS